jgi:glycine/serine hydroxymethyltransferase
MGLTVRKDRYEVKGGPTAVSRTASEEVQTLSVTHDVNQIIFEAEHRIIGGGIRVGMQECYVLIL